MMRALVVPVILCLSMFMLTCNNKGQEADGVKTIFHEDGKTVRQSIEYKSGKKNGYMKEYFANGTLKARQFYVNDSLNDTSIIYYPNGHVKSLQVYKYKLKHGCWKEYNKEGKLYSEIFFKNGWLDSTSTVYTYRTGKVLTRVTYKDGVKNGLEERYYANGKAMSKVYYDLGRPCLGTEEWYDSGRPINNDFAITVVEKNELLLSGKVTYIIRPENLKKGDLAYSIVPPQGDRKIQALRPLKQNGNGFEMVFEVPRGSHIMSKAFVAVFRKTPLGNTFIKVHSFNVGIENN